MKGCNYALANEYFITVCTKDRQCTLGRVSGDAVHLGELGKCVVEAFREALSAEPSVTCHAFVVMPNHVHALLTFAALNAEGRSIDLSRWVGRFKALATGRARRRFASPGLAPWQRSFFDRIVRNDAEHDFFIRYIREKPLRWQERQEGRSTGSLESRLRQPRPR